MVNGYSQILLITFWAIVAISSILLDGRNPFAWSDSKRTRSLSGGKATDGDNATAVTVVSLLRVGLVEGYAIRRIKMFNDRIFLDRYRRSYWLGTRYYALDNRYYLDSRETCAYRMNATERADLEYEDYGEPVLDIVYQCQRYAQYCCGLDCCENSDQFWG